MKVDIKMLCGLLRKRTDKGISAKFLKEIPEWIRSFFNKEIPLKWKCEWPRVPEHKEVFLDIKANGIKEPLTIYFDECGFEIDGYHRLACAIALGYETIEAEIHKELGVLVVLAHPDDEIIFGWPIMQDLSIKKSILVCSSDLNNPYRRHVKDRKYALEEVCKRLQITDFKCFDYPSEFYRLETRKESLKKMLDEVAYYIKKMTKEHPPIVRNRALDRVRRHKPVAFTHNAFGEYGNLDHRLINYVCTNTAKHIMFTDITQESNWLPVQFDQGLPRKLFFQNPLIECDLNMDFYNEMKAIYTERKCWTWSFPPIQKCRMYIE